MERVDMLKRVDKDNKNSGRVRAIFRFDRKLPSISRIMRRNWKMMVGDDVRLLKAFPEPPMVCFTRGKNLKEKICHAIYGPP